MKFMFDISGHGFGHLAQISPAIRETFHRFPTADILVRSQIGSSTLRAFLGKDIRLLDPPPDVGMLMLNAYTIDLESSYVAYEDLHEDLDSKIEQQAAIFSEIQPDILISDIGYVAISAASRANIPSYAVCSLHWGEIFDRYLGDREGAGRIHGEIIDSYSNARIFFLPQPRTSIPDIQNIRRIGLMGRHWGQNRKSEIFQRVGGKESRILATYTLGGIGHDSLVPELSIERGWLWIVPHEIKQRPEYRLIESVVSVSDLSGIPFLDVISSSDLVVTKTGYSTFAECALHGVPCLFLSRPDWPEAAQLESWMIENGYGFAVDFSTLTTDEWFEQALEMSKKRTAPAVATGHIELLDAIEEEL